jgi:hypothetical protein
MINKHLTTNDILQCNGSPIDNNLMPEYVGQLCIDITNELIYIAKTLDKNGWITSTSSGEIDISSKQDKTDNSLSTTNKTITGAINELKTKVDGIDISGKQNATDNSLSTTNKTIVGAINELFQNANNGKELIANAIGEPLSKDKTFSAMSTDINNLVSSFKSNLLNAGVAVDSNDKFKQLIDKIQNISEGTASVKYAEGHVGEHVLWTRDSDTESVIVNTNLDFTPTFIIVDDFEVYLSGPNELDLSSATVTNLSGLKINSYSAYGLFISDVDSSSFTIKLKDIESETDYSRVDLYADTKWYAIGIGSSGSSSGVIDIVCAASLPETVVENQIVVITPNVPSIKEIKDYSNCTPTSNGQIIIGASTTNNSGAMVPYYIMTNDVVVTLYLVIAKGQFNNTIDTYDGYIGRNGRWIQFSVGGHILYANGYDAIGFTTDNWSLSSNMYISSTSPTLEFKMKAYSGGWLDEYAYFRDSIDLTNVRQVRIVGSYTDNGGNTSAGVGFVKSSSFGMAYPEWEVEINLTSSVKEVITDVSSLTGNHYFGTVNRSAPSVKNALIIKEFELIY